EELWRQIYVSQHADQWRLIPSCVVADGLVIGTQPRNSPLYAFKADGPAGKRGYDQLLWRQTYGSDSPTALYYQGRIYNVHSQKGKIACIDPKSGKAIWEGQLDSTGDFRASPTGADGRIYLINIKGQAFTLSAGPEFKVLSRATMGGFPASSTISVANKRLYIRTAEKLYCIGKGAGTSAPAPAAKP
ncbi:MAG: PQQ-binding-like beta-propeller repeat protein, partial [Candidatus Sumerlaeota bacterium]|nr:PQQ-binding-like beta-propeller repeat protein [Candidatus Sumerlaeota bacterium]